MPANGLSIIRLSPAHNFKHFDCGDSDLNDFLIHDSINYLNELMAVTYMLESVDETVAFFSLLNDKISIGDAPTKSRWKKIAKLVPFPKRNNKSFPAMKIGRLGVHSKHQNKKLGGNILDYLKGWMMDNNKTGCRYITVDAYRQSIGFYERNGFNFLTDEPETAPTRAMYFDLLTISSMADSVD